jgi:uncharacterized membrane protein
MMAPMADVNSTIEIDTHGFCRRGFEVTRLAAFVDAAFAFAVTLLVISLDGIPTTVDGLVLALKGVPAFAACFAVIAQLWWTHTRFTWRFGLEDGTTVLYSLLMVFLVLVYVYPLKILFASGFHWISGGWLPTSFTIANIAELRAMFIIYGGAWGLLGLNLMGLYHHAWSQRGPLQLSADERIGLRLLVLGQAFTPALALLSILVAWNIPERPSAWMMAAPGVVYFGMFLKWPIFKAIERRMRQRAESK